MTTPSATPRRALRDSAPSKGDRREQALVAAAQRMLADGTFEEASVADLATEADISRAAFYFYFASKQALLASVVDSAVSQFNAQILAELDPDVDTDPSEALRATVRAAGTLWWDHRAVLEASYDLGTSLPEVYDRSMRNIGVVTAPTVELLLRHSTVREARNREDAEKLVTALVLMSERNFYDLMRRDPTKADLDALIELLSGIWLRAFGFDEERGLS